MQVVILVTDFLQFFNGQAEIFVIIMAIKIKLINLLSLNEHPKAERGVQNVKSIGCEDVEDVREEILVLQQVRVLVHQDPLKRVAFVKLALSHLFQGLEDHAINYIHDHGYDLEVEDGNLRLSIPVIVVDVPQLRLEQAIAVSGLLLFFNALIEHFAGNVIVNVVILVNTSLAVLAEEVVVLLGLDVQNAHDVEDNVGDLEHFFYVQSRVSAEQALRVEELQDDGRENEEHAANVREQHAGDVAIVEHVGLAGETAIFHAVELDGVELVQRIQGHGNVDGSGSSHVLKSHEWVQELHSILYNYFEINFIMLVLTNGQK